MMRFAVVNDQSGKTTRQSSATDNLPGGTVAGRPLAHQLSAHAGSMQPREGSR